MVEDYRRGGGLQARWRTTGEVEDNRRGGGQQATWRIGRVHIPSSPESISFFLPAASAAHSYVLNLVLKSSW